MTEVSGKIKALEWIPFHDLAIAIVSGDWHFKWGYAALPTDGNCKFEARLNGHSIAHAVSLDAAKAAAQVDYERRILLAIEAPSAEPVAWQVGSDGAVYRMLSDARKHVDSWHMKGEPYDEPRPLYAAPPSDARVQELVAAMEEIARQRKIDELETEADVEYGWDMCIDKARAALAQYRRTDDVRD